jgi:hypothetical protein
MLHQLFGLKPVCWRESGKHGDRSAISRQEFAIFSLKVEFVKLQFKWIQCFFVKDDVRFCLDYKWFFFGFFTEWFDQQQRDRDLAGQDANTASHGSGKSLNLSKVMQISRNLCLFFSLFI